MNLLPPPAFRKFLVSLTVMTLASFQTIQATDYFVDPSSPTEGNGSEDSPFNSIDEALERTDGVGGRILIAPDSTLTEPIIVRKGGNVDSPLIIDGQGSTILLGRNISEGPWTSLPDGEFRLEQSVPEHTRMFVSSPAFVNGLPIYADHPQGRGQPSWHGGKLRYDPDGKLILTLPDGLTLDQTVIVLTGSDQVSGLQATGGAHMIFQNLTVAFAGNDGFNFHNDCHDLLLNHVVAVFNGDQGISSHGNCVVEVKNSEVAFNGSQSAGIVDIGNSQTTYRNLVVHHNRTHGFDFKGAQHAIYDTVSYGNPGYNLPKPHENLTMINCTDDGTMAEDKVIPVFSQNNDLDTPLETDDRLGRFLNLTSKLQ